MFVFALGALGFGGFCAWMLYSGIRESAPATFKDYAADVALGGGSLCVIVTAIRALVS